MVSKCLKKAGYDWDNLVEADVKLSDGKIVHARFTKIYLDDAEPWTKEMSEKLVQIEVSDFPSMGAEKTKYFFKNEKCAGNIDKISKIETTTGNSEESFVKTLDEYSFSHGFSDTGKDILSPFEGVKYNINVPIYCDKVQRKYYMLKEQKDTNMEFEKGENEATPKKEEENCDPKKFDFSFDPKRDAWLIAKNANKIIGGNPSLMRYWQQRYRLFSKINDGIIMDEQGWFSVTPEILAKYTAKRLIPHKDALILDAFCGAGGNAIQFALAGAYVYAIDLDPIKLRCALKNAKVYGVENRITFICGNFFHVAKSFFYKERSANGKPIIDGIMLSPPWGGPEYYSAPVFEMGMCCPDGIEIFDYCLKISQNIAYFLPKQTSAKQLMELAAKTDSKNVEIEHNILNSKIKTLTAYYGNLTKKA